MNYHSQLLTKALNNFPEQAAFRMIVVKQNIAQNDYANALSELKKIDSKNWQQSQYRIAGFLAQKVSDHVSAIRFYNQLLKSKPNQGDINMAIAISLEALNETSLAVAKFQRALEDSSLKPIQRQFIAQRIAVLKG
jgi:Tfp pilus assembly protein PilF